MENLNSVQILWKRSTLVLIAFWYVHSKKKKVNSVLGNPSIGVMIERIAMDCKTEPQLSGGAFLTKHFNGEWFRGHLAHGATDKIAFWGK